MAIILSGYDFTLDLAGYIRMLAIDSTKLPFCYYHDDFKDCGKIAFYLKREIFLGERLVAQDVVWPSGEDAIDGEKIDCPHCGRTIYPLKIEHVKPTQKEK